MGTDAKTADGIEEGDTVLMRCEKCGIGFKVKKPKIRTQYDIVTFEEKYRVCEKCSDGPRILPSIGVNKNYNPKKQDFGKGVYIKQ